MARKRYVLSVLLVSALFGAGACGSGDDHGDSGSTPSGPDDPSADGGASDGSSHDGANGSDGSAPHGDADSQGAHEGGIQDGGPSDGSASDASGDAGASGYVISGPSGTITSEDGDSVTFALALTSTPQAKVTLDLSVSLPLEASIDKPQLVFDATNWSKPQTVTVTGLDDAILDGDQPYQVLFAPATSTDARYQGTKPAALSLVNYDNDEGPLSLSTGDDTSLVLFADGRVKAWGTRAAYTDPRFGVGDQPNEMGKSLAYVGFGVGHTVTNIVASGNSGHVCAFVDDGSVHCWGNNDKGQLGFGDKVQRVAGPTGPLDLGTGRTIKSLAIGGAHSCAILDNDSVKCWGQNILGELGLGDSVSRGDDPNEMGDNLPTVDLGTGRTAKAIFAADTRSCAILDDDSLKCWGENGVGELGIGAGLTRGDDPNEMGDNLPAVDLGGTPVTLTMGLSHTCALLVGGATKCWGFNNHGQLGLGDTRNRGLAPTDMGANLPAVNLGTNRHAVAISTSWAFTCAVLDDAHLKCWGAYAPSGFGLGNTNDRGGAVGDMGDGLPNLDLGPGRSVLSVSAGGSHACAVLDNHRVKCWGYNAEGELGLGDAVARGGAPGQMGAALPVVSLR